MNTKKEFQELYKNNVQFKIFLFAIGSKPGFHEMYKKHRRVYMEVIAV